MKARYILALLLGSCFFISCKKSWIDEKPNQALVVPTTVKDLQGLVDNSNLFNTNQPSLLESGADYYYLTSAAYQSRLQKDKNIYSWAAETNFYPDGSTNFEWDNVYNSILVANITLEGISKIVPDASNVIAWSKAKGTALFYRSYAFYNLAQLYAKSYNVTTASTDLGIILRTESDVNIPSVRSSVKQTYDQIISDLLIAKTLLPTAVTYPTQPSRAAAFAMLARVYLLMDDYQKAGDYADSCLSLKGDLINYSAINTASTTPFGPLYNKEIVFYSRLVNSPLFATNSGVGIIDTALFNSYQNGDLRQTLFFRIVSGRRTFKGNYTGNLNQVFNGIATDEVYLIRAESFARRNNVPAALNDLNTLLKTRWSNSVAYPTITASSSQEALQKILDERKKELCFRGLRWSDLRRLNRETQFATTITHGLFGSAQLFSLPPSDSRYVYPIPNSEILHSGVAQNPR